MTQPDEALIEELSAKASSRMIVYRLYPEGDDTAFNEFHNFSAKDLRTGIHDLSKAQDVLKLSSELQELTKTLQPTINQLTTGKTSSDNNNNSNNNNNNQNGQNWNKINGPRKQPTKLEQQKQPTELEKLSSKLETQRPKLATTWTNLA